MSGPSTVSSSSRTGSANTVKFAVHNDDTGVTVKTVCKTCNEGWMSALEAQVQAFLTPAIKDGTPVRFTEEQRDILAACRSTRSRIAT
jgi:hypothetical protein